MKNFIPLIALVIVIVGIQKLIVPDRQHSLPILGQIGSFQLVDRNDKYVSSDDFRGKPWVAHFFFTSCPQICPLIMKASHKIVSKFEGVEEVNIVSISVDSERDTPKVLNEYALKHGYSKPNWHFLTGTSDKVRELSYEQFKLGLGKDFSAHSTRMVLVDAAGNIRGYYDSAEQAEIDRLISDIKNL